MGRKTAGAYASRIGRRTRAMNNVDACDLRQYSHHTACTMTRNTIATVTLRLQAAQSRLIMLGHHMVHVSACFHCLFR